MEKKGRVYILDGSYPESVDIVSVKFGVNEHIEVGSAEEFWDNIGHWLALSKSPDYDVVMIVRASKCGLLWFEHGTVTSTEGRIKLKEVTDIEYYTMNPDTHEWIFGDKIKEYLDQPNDLIKRALVDESVFDIDEFRTTAMNNMDMATAGKSLMQSVLSEYMLDYYNYPQVPLAYFMEHILTEEKIANIIAPKYNLDKLITTGKRTKKSTQKILVDCVYSVI
ncbi:MAG: hypothetical protein IKC79_00150, partial [Clostridia bacterium]|nr:hypothetical protein [Clostridia bacterium]